MAQTRGIVPALYDNVDKTIFGAIGAQLKELKGSGVYELFNHESSEKKFERHTGIVGFDTVPEKGEGAAYATKLITQGYTKDFTHVEFGLGFEVTQTALEDDQYGQLIKSGQWLAFTARYVQRQKAANVINNGHTTETSPDGGSLFNTAHSLKGGGTARNAPATNSDLDVDAISQAIIDITTDTKFESGQIAMPIEGLTLVVPPAYELLADRILFSAGLQGVSDNDRNAIAKVRTWKLVVDPLLTDTDAWTVVATQKSRHGLLHYKRIPISLEEPMTDSRTRNRIYVVRFREIYGAYQWQGVYGCPGA